MQDKKTSHKRSSNLVRPTVPNWQKNNNTIHRVRRRVEQAPKALKVATVALMIAVVFYAGWAWPSGRNSAIAEQRDQAMLRVEALSSQLADVQTKLADAPTELVVENLETQVGDISEQLETVKTQLAEAPTISEVNELNGKLTKLEVQLEAKDLEIIGWSGRVDGLEAENSRLNQSLATQQQVIRSQTSRANRLQSNETARVAGLPAQLVANLTASPPYSSSDYRIAIYNQTIEEAFGIQLFDWLDEIKSVTANGSAVFVAQGAYSANNAGDVTEVAIPLPTLVSHGINDFTDRSFDYESGFLAKIDNQDVSQLMVWVENKYLVPKACADVTTLRRLVADAEAQVQSVAGSRETEVVWVSQSGQKFSSSQLTDAVLVANNC